MPWRKTSSALRNASTTVMFASSLSISRSLGITMTVSANSSIRSMPSWATSLRRSPSKPNGRVTTAMVSAPQRFAASATTGAAPVPVPPPMPAAMKTMSTPLKWLTSSSRLSSAACAPRSGSPPTPSPPDSMSPIRMLTGALENSSCCASVLIVTNCTPRIWASIIRLTALQPPPPTPTTLIGGTPSIEIRCDMAVPFIADWWARAPF